MDMNLPSALKNLENSVHVEKIYVEPMMLSSTGTNRLLVPPASDQPSVVVLSRLMAQKTWNALPEDVTAFQSEYTFRRQLRMWLFKKSFPDIII